MAPLSDYVKERAIALKAKYPVYVTKSLLGLLQKEFPNSTISEDDLQKHLDESKDLVKEAKLILKKPEIGIRKGKLAVQAILGAQQNWPIAIVDIPKKGKGLIATRDIQEGELVLAEQPLLRIPKESLSSNAVKTLVQTLSPERRDAFYELRRSELQTFSDELDIISVNAIAMGGKDDSGIFLVSSRINYSCLPNLNTIWKEDECRRHFYAITAIQKGEELGFACINQLENREKRREIIKERYGFICRCVACMLESHEVKDGNDRRKELKRIDRELDHGLQEDPHRKLAQVRRLSSYFKSPVGQLRYCCAKLPQIRRALTLLREEGLEGPQFSLFGLGYQINYLILNDIGQAKVWAAAAYETGSIAFGEDDERVQLYKRWKTKPRSDNLGPIEQMAFAMMAQMPLDNIKRYGFAA